MGDFIDRQAQLEPCEDTVSRNAVCKTLGMYGQTKMIREINNLPSAHAEKEIMKEEHIKLLKKALDLYSFVLEQREFSQDEQNEFYSMEEELAEHLGIDVRELI